MTQNGLQYADTERKAPSACVEVMYTANCVAVDMVYLDLCTFLNTTFRNYFCSNGQKTFTGYVVFSHTYIRSYNPLKN